MNIIQAICRDEGIKFCYMPDFMSETKKKTKGIALYDAEHGIKTILLNGDSIFSKWERRLIASHELAHLLFGHLANACQLSYNIKEDEARTFSCVFTALMLYDEYRKDAEKCKE